MSQNMSIDEIKRRMIDAIERLMKDGKIAEAAAAAKELSELEPGNARAKMLYGTCRQLLGDEETFKRIHDELSQVIKAMPDGSLSTSENNLWEKFHKEWMEATNPPVEIKTITVSREELDRLISRQLYGCPPYYGHRRLRRRLRCLAIVGGVVLLFWLAWWLGQKL